MRQNHNSAAATANVHDAHGYFAYRHDGTNLFGSIVVEAEKCAVANAIRTQVTQQLYRTRSFVLRGSWQRRPRREELRRCRRRRLRSLCLDGDDRCLCAVR